MRRGLLLTFTGLHTLTLTLPPTQGKPPSLSPGHPSDTMDGRVGDVQTAGWDGEHARYTQGDIPGIYTRLCTPRIYPGGVYPAGSSPTYTRVVYTQQCPSLLYPGGVYPAVSLSPLPGRHHGGYNPSFPLSLGGTLVGITSSILLWEAPWWV